MFRAHVRRDYSNPPNLPEGWAISEPKSFSPIPGVRTDQIGTFEVEDPDFPGSNCLQVQGSTAWSTGNSAQKAVVDLNCRFDKTMSMIKGWREK